jgi:ribosomal protein S27E
MKTVTDAFNCCVCGKVITDPENDLFHHTAVLGGTLNSHVHLCSSCHKPFMVHNFDRYFGNQACKHERTGSCSASDGVYLYVRCMDCWELVAISVEGAKRLAACPGYEPKKGSCSVACIHCGFDFWDHKEHNNG